MAAYLSRVLDQPVWNVQGQRLGRCTDVLVLERDEGAPHVDGDDGALALHHGGDYVLHAEDIHDLCLDEALGGKLPQVRVAVRTGDTPSSARVAICPGSTWSCCPAKPGRAS